MQRASEAEGGAPAELRENFPMRPEHVGRQVCDGERVVAISQPHQRAALPPPLAPLADDFAALQGVLHTYGDLLVADAVYLLASGRGDQAAEAMEAAASPPRSWRSCPPPVRRLAPHPAERRGWRGSLLDHQRP